MTSFITILSLVTVFVTGSLALNNDTELSNNLTTTTEETSTEVIHQLCKFTEDGKYICVDTTSLQWLKTFSDYAWGLSAAVMITVVIYAVASRFWGSRLRHKMFCFIVLTPILIIAFCLWLWGANFTFYIIILIGVGALVFAIVALLCSSSVFTIATNDKDEEVLMRYYTIRMEFITFGVCLFVGVTCFIKTMAEMV